MNTIVVDTTQPFAFGESVTEEYGDFHILQKYQLRFTPKKFSFTLDDVEIVSLTGEFCGGLKSREYLLKRNHLPLDAFCAMQLYKDEESLYELGMIWWKKWGGIESDNELDTMNFFGSVVSGGGTDDMHIVSYKYGFSDPPKFMPFEAGDKAWSEHNDYALVFKKGFCGRK